MPLYQVNSAVLWEANVEDSNELVTQWWKIYTDPYQEKVMEPVTLEITEWWRVTGLQLAIRGR